MMDICLFFLHAYLTHFIFAGSKIVISSLIFNKQLELLLLFHLSLIIPVFFTACPPTLPYPFPVV